MVTIQHTGKWVVEPPADGELAVLIAVPPGTSLPRDVNVAIRRLIHVLSRRGVANDDPPVCPDFRGASFRFRGRLRPEEKLFPGRRGPQA